MDTIIYFYMRREGKRPAQRQEPCRVERYTRKNYVLVRVGLEQWLVKRWQEAEKQTVSVQEPDSTGVCVKMKAVFAPFFRVGQRKKLRKMQEEERVFWQQQFEIIIDMMKKGIEGRGKGSADGACTYCGRGSKDNVRVYAGENVSGEDTDREGVYACECAYACEEGLGHLLRYEEPYFSAAGGLWRKCFGIPEFSAYLRIEWVDYMMQYAVQPHFLILGYHFELPRLLCQYVKHMKSLKWILPERHYSNKLQEFLDDFYDEYGLAVALEVLAPEDSYKRAHIACLYPANILDFSGEAQIPTGNIAKDSIWLDMSSDEEKCRRMGSRNAGIQYFSLKKEWKHPVLP